MFDGDRGAFSVRIEALLELVHARWVAAIVGFSRLGDTIAQMSAPLEQRLKRWLREELGIEDPRRVVRASSERILVSKVAPDFALDLLQLLELTPELFEETRVLEACEARARCSDAATPRSENWRAALHELLSKIGTLRGIPDERLAEIRVGIDSVFAVLESVLWTHPTLSDLYVPDAGEITAYRECVSRFDRDHDLFTRTYGYFEGRRVENRCPGATLARTLLAQAWRACTGTAAPRAGPGSKHQQAESTEPPGGDPSLS